MILNKSRLDILPLRTLVRVATTSPRNVNITQCFHFALSCELQPSGFACSTFRSPSTSHSRASCNLRALLVVLFVHLPLRTLVRVATSIVHKECECMHGFCVHSFSPHLRNYLTRVYCFACAFAGLMCHFLGLRTQSRPK